MKLSSILKAIYPDSLAPAASKLTDALAASFFPEDSTRLAHMRQACCTAKRVVSQMGYDAELSEKIITAALFHDIGYSERINRTGFHPLDGAVYLAHCNAPEDIIEAVLWHSSTPIEIKELPEINNIYQKCPAPDFENPVLRAVCYCDFRTSPLGESLSFGQRIIELESRFGLNSIPPGIARKTLPFARRTQISYAESISKAQKRPLPWVFCDIDGTLIEQGKRIDTTSVESINRYTAAGGRVSLVTGKHLINIQELLQTVSNDHPHAGVNGSIISRNGTITPYGPTLESYESLENELLANGIHYATYVIDGIWSRAELTEHELNSFTLVGETLPQSGATPKDNGVIKVLTYSNRKDRNRCTFVRQLAKNYGLNCVRTAEEFLEIGPLNHGKHSAVMHIMDEAGWPDLNSIAIGDSENDLSMFSLAGLSAAVANGAPEVLPAADLHIPSCKENGVARLLDALVDSAETGNWTIPQGWLAKY
ncbi:HAD-IIB family hydrolase [Maridesulfovibrio hydrothermalis]|uniref:HAD-superfamily hydrolase, subfamily IIB n=1 Tax=Maridesulfovibrio hydrothermalis AM13 = DSM 14728 TaxID=1121451 RepID=L0R7X7_9BACT|nr:HAD-IIB family hydrolase [Maridesulfovibrio hydrothermalis]CCO22843.1 HAD-superfamily hydrolase, subfamily IIB [Maridesulfovibrio hydrothermalis AM13 = DSM 14728]